MTSVKFKFDVDQRVRIQRLAMEGFVVALMMDRHAQHWVGVEYATQDGIKETWISEKDLLPLP